MNTYERRLLSGRVLAASAVWSLTAQAVPAIVGIITIPLIVRGLLEAAQRFKLTSLVKIPMGVLTFIAPLLVLRFTPNLAVMVLTLIAVRLIGAIVYAMMCHRAVHHHGTPTSIDRGAARTLL